MINSNILVIHKSKVLFSILYEIKSILNFQIKFINEIKMNSNLNKSNLVVISSDNKFNIKNQIKIETFPVSINKLIEIVNIQF